MYIVIRVFYKMIRWINLVGELDKRREGMYLGGWRVVKRGWNGKEVEGL